MKISSAPVSYQTHVRPAQVRDMIRCCEDLQQTFNRLADATTKNLGHFQDISKEPDWKAVALQWPQQPAVREFKEAALNNHFVCANWKAFDELQGEAHRSREELLTARSLVPVDAGFMWLRRFIHSVVTWEGQTRNSVSPSLQVAANNSGWMIIARLLQRELDQAEEVLLEDSNDRGRSWDGG
ncbi:hypothetical protein HZU72_08530 [Halomonas sp. QX-2]|uniref:Uncharacterized protein n=1 Tax=Vreelandella sedimenti TaxID=2729618 RepID=A0A7Z0SM64_9GAMM|nr:MULTISPECIES: hypothetical protein [Halomonas]NYT72470.1 hypothetical protein [Halomonas sedimenti]|tara:strand:+ start:2104 stop:2652 length:549 start_codon:yes stop_codon:yes gene_type:complete